MDDAIKIRVVMQADYIFDPRRVDGRTPEEIIQEFFMNFSLDRHHAARDPSRVYGATKVLSAEVVEDLGYDFGGGR